MSVGVFISVPLNKFINICTWRGSLLLELVEFFFGKLKDGTQVLIEGKLKEDIRVNADNPNTTRSKVYINVIDYKVEKGDKDE